MFIQQSYAGFKKQSRRGSPKVYEICNLFKLVMIIDIFHLEIDFWVYF